MIYVQKKQLLKDLEDGYCVEIHLVMDDLGCANFQQKIVAVNASGEPYAILVTQKNEVRYFKNNALSFCREILKDHSVPVLLRVD
jgi:hypothetical protein